MDGCFTIFKSCMKNAQKGLPYSLETDPEVVNDTDPGLNYEVVTVPVPVTPESCPQMVPGDNRSWGQWAQDQCLDIWQNDLGLPLPPTATIPRPDISGFMRDCVSSLRSCSKPAPIHTWCGDGCSGLKCSGSGSGTVICPTPLPGAPVVPSPGLSPVLSPSPIFVIP
jgi:hypothetical protein